MGGPTHSYEPTREAAMAAFAKSGRRALDQSAGLTRSVAKTDRPMEAWHHPSIARMTPNRRVTWQATLDDETS
jgi:hypothetical protein